MKPLDFGGEGVTGSVNPEGRIIALNFYHPDYGYVTLTSAEPFSEAARFSPAKVRAYRAGLAQLDGFGVRLTESLTGTDAKLLAAAVPNIDLTLEDERKVSVNTYANSRGGVQLIAAPAELPLRWSGKLCLQRCAYTQLTEGGPLPMPPLAMHLYCLDGLLIIHNPQLAAAVAVSGLNVSRLKEQRDDQPLELDFEISGDVLAYGVGVTVEAAAANARWLLDHANVEEAVAQSQAVINGLPDDVLVWRAVSYGRMMAIPASEGVCLLTDHMLLPLSWNRDAYFIARALLSAGQQDLVRRHLIWTFETAERRNGVWARCYMANGRIKDEAFQLDQQLYPLLELAEYVLETDDQVTLIRLYPHIDAVLMAVDARRVGVRLLFPTDETPADDPIALPYHLSSHILMWHTLTKLNALGGLGSWSERISPLHETIQTFFIDEHNGQRLYAYATDGRGSFHFYHDANDFPLPLAPTWNFVPADDPIWQATVEFAFSEANQGGFYDGRLGSIHTPAPWPLGDVQDLIIARTLQDKARAENALANLHAAAQSDGALPEAYDAASGSVISRHWFAWPNAAYACAELGAFEK